MTKAANGRSSIHRRKNGDGWEGWVSLGVDPLTGKRRRRHVRGRTKSEVAAKIAKLEAQRDVGAVAIGRDTALSEWLASWVAARSAVVRPTTISGYRTDQLHVARSGIGGVRLRALAPEHLEMLYAAVLAAGCSAGSVAHVRRTVSAALNTAVQRGYVGRNLVPFAQMPKHEQAELEPYNAEEIARILAAARPRRNGVRWSLVSGAARPPPGRGARPAVG